MSKRELIDQITQLNRSAGAEFLADFTEAELQQYLANLEAVWTDFSAQYLDGVCEDESSAQHEPDAVLTG